MAEQSDTPKILEEISRSTTAKKKRSGSGAFTSALLAIVLVGGLAGAGYFWNQQQALQSSLDGLVQENTALVQRLQSQSTQLQTLQQQLDAAPPPVELDDTELRNAIDAVQSNVSAELNNLRRQLANSESQLASTQARLAQVSEEPVADWKLGEAQYLLGLANQKLQLEGDISGALLLLQQSDSALLAAESSIVLPVREAIASHLQNLRAVQPVDRDGIYLRIDALVQQVEEINLLSSMRESFTNRRLESSEPVEVTATEYGIVNATVEFLSSVFVWRQWEDSPEAMLMPGQDGIIKQNIALSLEQAKLAVLRRDQQLYTRALSQATDSLQRYDVTATAPGLALMEEISALSMITVEPALPDLGETLDQLSTLVSEQR